MSLLDAAEAGDVELAKRLLAAGADAAAADPVFGNTPLHEAAAGGHVEVVRLLCRDAVPATLSALNKDGLAPIDLAKEQAIAQGITDLGKPHAEAAVAIQRRLLACMAGSLSSLKGWVGTVTQ